MAISSQGMQKASAPGSGYQGSSMQKALSRFSSPSSAKSMKRPNKRGSAR